MCDNNEFRIALKVALAAHKGQFRRNGETPYIEHVFNVSYRVETYQEKIVALLHDVVEDTHETIESLREQGISKTSLDAISLLTRYNYTSYEDYLSKIIKNPLARNVKIADMLANLSDEPTDRQILKYAKGLIFLLT